MTADHVRGPFAYLYDDGLTDDERLAVLQAAMAAQDRRWRQAHPCAAAALDALMLDAQRAYIRTARESR